MYIANPDGNDAFDINIRGWYYRNGPYRSYRRATATYTNIDIGRITFLDELETVFSTAGSSLGASGEFSASSSMYLPAGFVSDVFMEACYFVPGTNFSEFKLTDGLSMANVTWTSNGVVQTITQRANNSAIFPDNCFPPTPSPTTETNPPKSVQIY